MLSRNQGNRFSQSPSSVDIKRSYFPNNTINVKTTGSVGKLYPICYPIEILPGDEFKMNTSQLARMQTPLVPVMDNAFIDTFWFFVPMRTVWEHTKNFFGESEVAGFDTSVTYQIPTITAPSSGFAEKSYADYLGIPTKIEDLEVSALQFRAIRSIWNNYFRDQNLEDSKLVNTGDDESDMTLLDLLPVSKFHDYFTSALPYPQKGPDVLLPISGEGEVYASSEVNTFEGIDAFVYDNPIFFSNFGSLSGHYNYSLRGVGSSIFTGVVDDIASETPVSYTSVYPLNLKSKFTNVNSATIIQLRQAFAVQKLYENLSLGGSRYFELLRNSFGVVAPQLQLQLPEYLGGARQRVNMTQVVQNSQTTSGDTGSQLGTTGAFSLTTLFNKDFDKSFVEHGYLIGLYCVRNQNSYQQGLHRQWSRRDMLDFYFPELANIGEQEVLLKEIYASGTSDDELVFGYQERYAEYRYFPNVVTGEFRSNASNSLDEFHYADYYNSAPILSASWVHSSPANVDRTLSVTSEVADQFYSDFKIVFDMWRKMPLYGGHSIQGWY